MPPSQTRVAIVAALFRYPVKSMRGETPTECWLGWHGLAGDRRYAFLRPTTDASPWLTARQQAALIRYRPRFRDPGDPERSAIEVVTPDGVALPLESPELLEEIVRHSRFRGQLVRLGVGAFDSMPLSLIARQSIASIGGAIDAEVDVRQFRPNVVLDIASGEPYQEATWLGSTLAFGDSRGPRVRVDRVNVRCMVTGLDPATASYDPAVLDHVMSHHDGCAGVYATPERPGVIHVGDPVYRLQ